MAKLLRKRTLILGEATPDPSSDGYEDSQRP